MKYSGLDIVPEELTTKWLSELRFTLVMIKAFAREKLFSSTLTGPLKLLKSAVGLLKYVVYFQLEKINYK